MKSVRTLFTTIEIFTLVTALLFVFVIFYLFQVHIKSDYINNQSSNIGAVDIMIEDIVRTSMADFDSHIKLKNRDEALALLTDFSDIYYVTDNLKISGIVKKEHASQIFIGYSVGVGHLGEFLRSFKNIGTKFSPITRSAENEKLSFYVASKIENGFVIGRIGLERVMINLSQNAEYTKSIIIISAKDGYVLASTKESIQLTILPPKHIETLNLDGTEYLITRIESKNFENEIAILTPLSIVYKILKSFRIYFAIFIFIILFLFILKIFYQTFRFLKPLKMFSSLIKNWDIEKNQEKGSDSFLKYEEIASLYNSFDEKSSQIKELVGELKANEAEMNKIRLYLKNIIDSMPSILVSIDTDGVIKEWNYAAYKFTGIPATQAIGQQLWSVVPILKKYENDCKDAINSRQQKNLGKELMKTDSDIYMNIFLFPLIQNGVKEVAIRLDDVTELEKTEQQLQQAQKMETIGTLVGGLAHDFNNILAGIVGTLSLMKFYIEKKGALPSEKLQDYIKTMETSAERATDMVKQMLMLSNRQKLAFAPVSLIAIIKHVVKICANTFDKRIEIIPSYPDEDAVVLADEVQIEQVLLNLAINSMHAMTIMRKSEELHGGKLLISINKIHSDDYFCSRHLEASSNIDYWIITVQDNGIGMDVKTVAKIFDPFFSTKAKGKGTGLGLTMVYNIVHQHKGFIDVYTEPEMGSTFNIFLPVLENALLKIREKDNSVSNGVGTILVVDDEEHVRIIAANMLESCGYSVIFAEDGIQGIEKYKENKDIISLVILDINMPRMSGNETFMHLLKINPEIKVIVASGFIRDEKSESLIAMGAKTFLQKPYTLTALSKTVSQVLNGKEKSNLDR